jgi:hypothetical protein
MFPDSDVERLRPFYEAFRDAVERVRGSKHPPLILCLLTMKSNDRADVLRTASIDAKAADFSALQRLRSQGLVRETDERMKFAVTALGVWICDRASGTADEKSLIEFIDEKYFRFADTHPPLTEKEKVIVGSLIAARAFSEESAVNLSSDTLTKDAWRDILQSVYDRFKSGGIVRKLTDDDLFRKGGNEHPVSHLIRHTDSLPKKTRGLFVAGGRQRYFLNVYNPADRARDNLAYLVLKVVDDAVEPSQLDSLSRFLRDVAYGDAMRVFDLTTHKYAKTEIDDDVNEALRTAVLRPETVV